MTHHRQPACNGVDTATLFATLDAVKAQNEIARFQFRASNTWRFATGAPVVVLLSHRPNPASPTADVLESVLARGMGTRVELGPLTRSATARLLKEAFPDLTADAATHIWRVSAGLPFTALEMARNDGTGPVGVVPTLPGAVLVTLHEQHCWGQRSPLTSCWPTSEHLQDESPTTIW